jgi:RNA polymerase sigma factor (sigma-70 family)
MLNAEIIKECIEGNRIAQERLYNFYASRMRGTCLRYAGSVFEAEDIFQDGFIKVFTNLKNYKNQGSLDGWIRRIIVNTAIDAYKKNIEKNAHVSYDMLEEEEIAQVEIADNLDEEDLIQVLAKLPDGYRIVFNLYAIEGFSHKEIADKLEITESTSKSQLFKARKQIQHLLEYKYNITGNEKENLY